MSEDELRNQTIDNGQINRGWISIPQVENLRQNKESYQQQQNAKRNKNLLMKADKENGKHIKPLLNSMMESCNNNEWKSVDNAINNNDNGVITETSKINNNNSVNSDNVYNNYESKNVHSKDKHEDDEDDSTNCGIGSCKPRFLRNFASTHMFMVVFLLAWVLQGMYSTYFVSVITTIEKLFQIKSKTIGMLLSVVEIGQISTSLFLTYFAGRGHRPRWIACGMIMFSIASFCCTLPHFIYGDDLLNATNNLITTDDTKADFTSLNGLIHNNTGNDKSDFQKNLCFNSINNITHDFNEDCNEAASTDNIASTQQLNYIVLVIFVLSLYGVGVGQTAVSTLGIPYIDDNVASKESPIYLAITIGVRILGPAFGFILGSFCIRLYVKLTDVPPINPTDPRWVGAWWLGFVLISGIMALTSLAMLMFPKHLKGKKLSHDDMVVRTPEEKMLLEKPPRLQDFPKAIKRQLSNDILMCRTASCVLHLLPIAGLYTFLPKYLETQFKLPAHEANMVSGTGGILVMGIGIVLSGFTILKFNLSARKVAAWIAATALIYSLGIASLIFIKCPAAELIGSPLPQSSLLNSIYETKHFYQPTCNNSTMCNCDFDKFSPICGSNDLSYFSPCHAGCSSLLKENGEIHYYNCSCINSDKIDIPEATRGYCDEKCINFYWFLVIFCFVVFLHSTSEVGSMLLIMRCTDPKDKAMAMGVIQFAIGLFGNVPCPIIYGSVVDSACLIWDSVCGKAGACSLYDNDSFRQYFLGITAGIMFIAFCIDLIVWYKADRIDIDPETSKLKEAEKIPDTNV